MGHLSYLYISYTFGFFAVFISIFSFYPQFKITKKNKSTKSLSLYSYIVFVLANITWLAFGIISFIEYFVHKNYVSDSKMQILIHILWNSVIFIPYSFTTYFSVYILKIKIQNVKLYGEKK